MANNSPPESYSGIIESSNEHFTVIRFEPPHSIRGRDQVKYSIETVTVGSQGLDQYRVPDTPQVILPRAVFAAAVRQEIRRQQSATPQPRTPTTALENLILGWLDEPSDKEEVPQPRVITYEDAVQRSSQKSVDKKEDTK